MRVAPGVGVIVVLDDPGSPTEVACFGNKGVGMRLGANNKDRLPLKTTVNATLRLRQTGVRMLPDRLRQADFVGGCFSIPGDGNASHIASSQLTLRLKKRAVRLSRSQQA